MATALLLLGAGLVWSGVNAGAGTVTVEDSPEGRAFTLVQQMSRTTPTTIRGRRIIVGDSLVRGWVGQQDAVYAWPGMGAQDIANALLRLPQSEPVDELVIWLGNDDLARRWDTQLVIPSVARIIEALQPREYLVIVPLPVWSKETSLILSDAAAQQLREQFPGRVVNPHPVLQEALTARAPVYYDDFRLTAVGYAHVTNLVERAFGGDVPTLAPIFGIEEYGRMPTPVPAGLLAEGSYLDLPGL